MQSLWQYRRFGELVRRQYEEHESRAKALSKDPRSAPSSPPSPFSALTKSLNSSPLLTSGAPKTVSKFHQDLHDSEPTSPASATSPTSVPGQSPNDHGVQEEEEGLSTVYGTIAADHSDGTALAALMPGIEVRRWAGRRSRGGRQRREGGQVFVVGFEGKEDVMDPRNWTQALRLRATINIGLISFVVSFASSIDSAVVQRASADFKVSQVTESLATGLFLMGLGAGALFAGPVSETIGRNPVYIATLSIFMVCILASGFSPNIESQSLFRFIAGCFASTPLTCAGGSISDLWSSTERIWTFPIFAGAAFMGPVFGPVVGGFVAESSTLDWRWTEWATLALSGVVLALLILLQPETHPSTLMRWKAHQLRQLTGDDRYKAKIEILESTFSTRLGQSLYRPFALAFREPIIILITIYLTLTFVIQFTFLNGYNFIFVDTYHFTQAERGLCFLGIGLGLICAVMLVFVLYPLALRDLAKIEQEGGTQLPPEFNLWHAMLGAPLIPISMLWMGWTAYPQISYWSPLAASVLCGFGLLTIFISSYQYIIDTYEEHSASALTSVTLIRYVAAGAMVEVADPMYKNLGVQWTLTILAALSVIMVPVPYLFWWHGALIRSWSKYAVV